MFELSEEETLMVSSDNSVKLTTHRIIHESDNGRQQVMLEDFVGIQLNRSSVGAYGVLLFIFVAIALLLLYLKLESYYEFPYYFKRQGLSLFDVFWEDKGFLILLLILMVLHYFYHISRRNNIVVVGKYNSIEFRVKNFRNPSIQRMLNKVVEQSNALKASINDNGI